MTTKKAQIETFYAQGDFGYVRDQRKEMSIFCEPLFVVSLIQLKEKLIFFFYFYLLYIFIYEHRTTHLWSAQNT